MASVNDLLDQKAEEIKRPPNPPEGHYRFEVSRDHAVRETGGDWTFIEIPVQAKAAQEDVDPDELEAFGRGADNIRARVSFGQSSNEADTATNEDNAWRMQEFLKHCGLDPEPDESLRSQLGRAKGAQFIGKLVLEADRNDPEIKRVRLTRTMSLSDLEGYA